MQKFGLFAMLAILPLAACEEMAGRNSSDCTPITEAMQGFVGQPVYPSLKYIKDNPALFANREIEIHGTQEPQPIEYKGGITIEVNAPEVNTKKDLESAEVTEIRCIGFDVQEET